IRCLRATSRAWLRFTRFRRKGSQRSYRSRSTCWGCTPKPSKIPSKWISDFHSLVQPSFADIGSIFTATIPFVAEELRSISMRCWQTWHWKKATKGSLKPSNYGFDPIRPRNVMANCLTEFSRVWAYNLRMVESGDYFFFAISPNQSVTAFRSEIGEKIWLG